MRVKSAMLAIAVLIAFTATSASALEMHGYFRDSAGFNGKGGSQACFKLPGSDFKARLGNECELYLEMGFVETAKVSNTEWRVEFMPAYAQDSTTTGTAITPNRLFLQQMWLGVKFNDWGGINLWAGRRYFRRHDVHSLDWFYWNPAQGNAAAGVEDINIGFGKAAVSVFRIDAPTPSLPAGSSTLPAPSTNLVFGTYAVPEIRVYDMPVNTDGTLEVGLDLGIAADQNKTLGVNRADLSPLLTIQHNQAKILGGSNTLALQFGLGAFANESGDGPGQLLAGGTNGDKQWRIIEHLVVNPIPEISGALVLVFQDKTTTDATGGARIFSAEIRPSYHFSDNFKFTLDAFGQILSVKNAPAGAGTPMLVKVTAAPTIVLARGYWARPELRLFVTYAKWNNEAAALGTIGNGAFSAPNGVSFGANVETWF